MLRTETEVRWIAQAKKGRGESFDLLVQKYQRPIYNLCFRMVGNADDAGDLAQEAFIRAFQHLGSYDPHYAFSTWLNRIASNVCIDHLRRRQRAPASLEDEMEHGWEPVDPGRSPQQQVEAQEDRALVQRLVAGLPEKYRLAVVLRHMQDKSIKEIAEILDLPEGTVKTHLFHARELLRRSWAADADSVPGDVP